MQRQALGQIEMESGSNISQQSMTQLLQSCTALHAVSAANAAFQLETNNNNVPLQPRKIQPNSPENDENAGPVGTSGNSNSSQNSNAKMELRADLNQLAALRRNRAPTMSRRNERERNRVRYLNFTFDVLRQHLPRERVKGKAKKMSKVDTLRGAIDYIRDLQDVLGDGITKVENASSTASRSPPGGASFGGTESEADSLSPVGSPRCYSSGGVGSPGGGDGAAGSEVMSDQEDVLGGTELAGWFC